MNFCSIALNQGRTKWRHDSVLNFLTKSILTGKPESLEVFADLPGLDLNGFTIPPDILPTQQRPDLVILDRNRKTIFVLELTVSFERNFEAANARKTARYTALKSDLEERGYQCHLIPFEVGSRGYVSKSNRLNLINVFVMNKLKPNAYKIIKQMSKISLLCSYSIFHAYTQPTWRDPPFLEP